MAEGNLHLDTDYANLAAHVLQHNRQFRSELAQLCSGRGVGNRNGERAELQAQYLAALREIVRRDSHELALQARQSLNFGQ